LSMTSNSANCNSSDEAGVQELQEFRSCRI
jgi:hypothetical protein